MYRAEFLILDYDFTVKRDIVYDEDCISYNRNKQNWPYKKMSSSIFLSKNSCQSNKDFYC